MDRKIDGLLEDEGLNPTIKSSLIAVVQWQATIVSSWRWQASKIPPLHLIRNLCNGFEENKVRQFHVSLFLPYRKNGGPTNIPFLHEKSQVKYSYEIIVG